MYVGSEARGHGMQVFDLTKLLRLSPANPRNFSTATDLTAWFSFGPGGKDSTHNIVANEEAEMIYAVGTNRSERCAGGLWMVDVSDPSTPTDVGCVASDGYVHDAQCLFYSGPDRRYLGHEICFNYNEDTLTIVDVTNKKAPKQLSRTGYKAAEYTHQGWLVDSANNGYLLMDDEYDEYNQTGVSKGNNLTTTYVWDVRELTRPRLTGTYQGGVKSIVSLA
jgi:choice-of-anchor B domain-containing protein